MTRPRVVITGVGAVTPLGGAHDLVSRWIAGESGIRDGEGACVEFEPTDTLTPKEARRADRFTQLGLAASDAALADAGWASGLPYDADRIGCVIGTGIGGIGTMEDQHDTLRDRGAERVSPLTVPLMMANALPGAMSMRHGLLGQVYGVVSACAAGAHAIGAATRMIQSGEADAVVTGGGEAALTPLSRAAFASLDALSETGISRPFDRRRDGFVMGEGAGVLVLEDAEKARERGATVLGEVLGYGATADAHHITAPDPEGRGATKAIRHALADAGLSPEDVDYVNAHGTSTPLNDRAETAAIKSALGDHAARVPVSSTKSAIGHLLGAAGAVEAIATVLALREGLAPPTLGYEEADEDLDLDYVPGAAAVLCLGVRA
jgi:3-oxoacyl-[acyl-carrier-protein] synthase II